MWFTPGCRLMGSLSLILLLLTCSTFSSSWCQFLWSCFSTFIMSLRSLSFHLSSLVKGGEKSALLSSLLNKTLSFFRSLCLIFTFFSGTHIPYSALASTGPSSLLGSLFSAALGNQSRFDGSYYRPALPGQEAGIFIAADTGRSNTPHPFKRGLQLHTGVIYYDSSFLWGKCQIGFLSTLLISWFLSWCAFAWNVN